ncbi:MAG TPA: M23 family metallopeptidase [Balneolaceae bacterium]|nr:M23 family metallopeptidase [Balneolaceae bacterium]
MWEFLKKIFFDRYREYRVDVYPEEHPQESRSFHIQKSDTAWLFGIFLLLSILFSTLLFYTTPLGNIFETRFETAFRKEVLEITQRVEALQDSLVARDLQLNDLKNFVRTVPDTTFEIEPGSVPGERAVERLVRQPVSRLPAYDMLNRFEILNQPEAEDSPFLALMPAEGAVTQGFSYQTGHYGVDIALPAGTPFLAISDGVVFYTEWTVNYGYVLLLQHPNGIVSVYKHAERLLKKQGDFVVKGDVLGSVGDRGLLSSGSHLHFEIWDKGIPRNPLSYLDTYRPARNE